MRCMPWPLAALCWLDERLYGTHDDSAGWACHLHDWVMHAHWRLMPGRTSRFLRKMAEEG